MATTLVLGPEAVDERPGVLARLGLLRDLEHPRQAFSYLTPNWFASVMGTGIVAVAAHSLPWQPPGLAALAHAMWICATVLLIVLAVAAAAHWTRYPAVARGHVFDPVMSFFYGAPPMALMTVGAGTLLVGRDVVGPAVALPATWTLWALGTATGLGAAVLVPYLMFVRRGLAADQAFGGWLMPVVPPMVSASTGALLVPYASPGVGRAGLLLGCYIMFTGSLAASTFVIVRIVRRLAHRDIGAARLVPTVWIVLGPLGQSITAANLLGAVAHLVLPQPYTHDLIGYGIGYGIVVLAAVLGYAAVALALTVRVARDHLPFSLTWWSFTFPVGTVVTGTSALARATGFGPFRIGAVALFGALLVAWTTVAARTARGAARGNLLLNRAGACYRSETRCKYLTVPFNPHGSVLMADGLRLHVNALDYTLLTGYFIIVIAIGLAARRAIATSEDFFLSGRSLPGWITGLAFISANLGAIEVLGNAANGAQYGISTVHFYWIGAVPAMLFLALVMMPFYYGSHVHSVPEYLRRRFGPGAHLFNGLSFAAAGVLVAGVNLYALALVIKALLGWPLWIAIVVSGLVVLVYVGVGGLSGAIYNEVLQFFVIVAGLIPVVVVGLVKMHGWSGLKHTVSQTGPLHGKALATWAGTHVGHSTNPLGDWIGIIFGLGFVLSFGYWTTNFAEVQRALSAKDLSAARRTSIIGAFPKIFIPILTVVPGLLALALLKDKIGPGGEYTYNDAIPYLIGNFLPNGVLGVALTGLLAAFMAGMAANISSFNTVWTYDIWRPYVVKDREDSYYLRHGRIMTVVGIVISMGTAFIAAGYNNLFNYIQLLFSFFNAPLFATFLLGLFWKRMTAAGGVWGLATGTLGALVGHFLFVGASFLGHAGPFISISSGQSQNFYGAIIAFVSDLVVSVGVSLVTRPKTSAELEGLVWGQAPTDLEDTGADHWYTNVWWLSGIAAVLTVAMSVLVTV